MGWLLAWLTLSALVCSRCLESCDVDDVSALQYARAASESLEASKAFLSIMKNCAHIFFVGFPEAKHMPHIYFRYLFVNGKHPS